MESKRLGEVLKVRVTKVREDGKMDLSLREVAYRQMNADAVLCKCMGTSQGASDSSNEH